MESRANRWAQRYGLSRLFDFKFARTSKPIEPARCSRWRRAARAFGIAASVVIIVFALGEVGIRTLFRDYVPSTCPSDFDEQYKMQKAKAGSEGRYVLRNVKNGYFRINNEGWNSFRDYYPRRNAVICRIATIGASNTEAFPVEVKSAYPSVLENTLRSGGVACEVYQFGYSAIHLAQALHITRYAIHKFQPDVITIAVIGGQILAPISKYDYFLSLEVDSAGNVTEVMPKSATRSAFGNLKGVKQAYDHSTLLVYLNRTFALRLRAMNLLYKCAARVRGSHYVPYANLRNDYQLALLDPACLKEHEIAMRYLLKQFKAIEQQDQARIVFILSPRSLASYNGTRFREEGEIDPTTSPITLLEELGLRYLDLTGAFADDYERSGIKFDYLYDGHLNEHGHNVQGVAIARYLIEEGIVIADRGNGSLRKGR